jgi:hypothetical protein
MKRLICFLMVSAFFSSLAWASPSKAKLTRVKANHHHVQRHRAHKATRHHAPKHHRHAV